MSRPNQKMIGIYVPLDLHEEIKSRANSRGQTIKEYFLSLHETEVKKDVWTEVVQIRKNTEKILDMLHAFAFSENVQPLKEHAKEHDPKDKEETHREIVPSTDVDLGQYSEYLERYRKNPRQYRALRETLKIILELGGKATSVQIKEGRGFSRTTMIKRQIQRLAEDGVVAVDYSVKPFVVTLL